MSDQKILSAAFILLIAWIIGFACTNRDSSEEIKKSRRELGQRLFFDTRLSYNNTKSCSSCHDPRFAFTDGYRRSITASGDIVPHNAPSLINVGSLHYFDWANPSVTSLLQQSNRPLYNTTPIELGVKGNEQTILARFAADESVSSAFSRSFPREDSAITLSHIQVALAAFTASLQSMNAPYDRYIKGDSTAISPSAIAGLRLFLSARLSCNSCHPPPFFTNAAITSNIDSIFFNTGSLDTGRFKVPTLRNIAITAPYTHNGSVNSISEMIDNYARGGRVLKGFTISPEEKSQLIDFLFTLTDSSIFSNPAFSDPSRQSRK